MGKVYAWSDIHGNWKLAEKVLNYLKPDDKLYFLGDAIDRGGEGVKILQALMKDPRVTFIKGNHEQFMLEYMASNIDWEYRHYDPYLWFYNGGKATYEALLTLSDEEFNKIYNFLNNLPIEVKYESPFGHTVIMEHAGYTPFDIPHRSHDPLWDRSHFQDIWNCGSTASKETIKNTYVVHGHTPTLLLEYEIGYINQKEPEDLYEWYQEKRELLVDGKLPHKPTVIRYCDNHKFDIDMGTHFTNTTVLLDLDTFEEIYFDCGGAKNA